MGNALVILKVMPEGPDETQMVEDGLKQVKEGELKDIKREPIGFGIEAIKAGFVIPDKVDGAMERLENAIKKIKGVSQVEVEGMTLL